MPRALRFGREAPSMGKLHRCVVLSALVVAGSLGAASVSAGAASTQSYTTAQAAAGAKSYTKLCLQCHGAKLEGVTGPPLKGTNSPIVGIRTLGYVYGFVKSQMPLDKPGSLSPATCTTIIAYIYQQNGHPAGRQALSPTAAQHSTARM